jgi:hypothetical protein
MGCYVVNLRFIFRFMRASWKVSAALIFIHKQAQYLDVRLPDALTLHQERHVLVYQ